MSKQTTAVKPFGWGDKIGYALGDFGCNMSFSLIGSYMMLFYTQVIGISLTHYGFIILGTKIWDGINDPIIGAICDRFKPKGTDKFKPWIKWGSIPLAFSGALLFMNTSSQPYWLRLTVCIVAYLIWDICYTIVNVPYGSLSSVMTEDSAERAQLSSFRSLGAFAAFIPIMLFMPQLTYKKEMVDGKMVSTLMGDRLFTIALVMGIIGLICFQLMVRLVTERVQHDEHDGSDFNYFEVIRGFFSNRTMLAVSMAALMTIVFMMSSSATNALVFQMYFGDGKLASWGVLAFLPTLVLTPFMKPLVKTFGKKNLALWPLVLGIAMYGYLLITPTISATVWIVCTTIAGFASGFYNLLAWALVNDGIDSIELATGKREEGSIYATYSMIRKLGQGVGQALIPFIIAATLPGLDMANRKTWSPEYGMGIKNLGVSLSLVGYILVFVIMLFIYDFDKKREAEMPGLLAAKRAEKNK